MKSFTIFFCLTLFGISLAILDGEVVKSGSRFVGQLLYRHKTICTVAAVKEDYVLGAAHCHDDSEDDSKYTVKLGSYFRNEGVSFTINATYIMPGRIFQENDMMLIKLNEKIDETFPIAIITISSTPPKNNAHFTVAGFGRTTTGLPDRLLKTTVHFIDFNQCKKIFHLYETNTCTANNGHALMDGDSGAVTYKAASDGQTFAFAVHNRSGKDMKSPYVEMNLQHPDAISFFTSHGIHPQPFPEETFH